MTTATAQAFAKIAFIKYWGNKEMFTVVTQFAHFLSDSGVGYTSFALAIPLELL
jgi:hypothetical protein